MKFKFLTLLALGMATASQVSAVDVYITGSTAGRASVHQAIMAVLGDADPAWFGNASRDSAQQASFNGTFNGTPYNVFCSWSGSAAGVQSLVENSNPALPFLDQTSGGQLVTPTATFTPHTADVAFSDVFQSSTAFTSVELVDTRTIVLPFKFFTSEGSPVTNVTSQLARVLFQAGNLRLSLFTSNPAHDNGRVLAVGRDGGSGTRITTMAEIGVGAFGTLQQYQPTLGFTAMTITGVTTTNASITVTHSGASPAVGQPLRGTNIPVGARVATVGAGTFTMNLPATGSGNANIQAGQNVASITGPNNGGSTSGGTVAGWTAATTHDLVLNPGARTPCYLLGYIGISDGNLTALPNGAVECQYNGVTYSEDNVRNGFYTLWGYLHLFVRPELGDVNPDAAAFATELGAALDGIPGTSGLQLSTMKVERLTDGGDVTPN